VLGVASLVVFNKEFLSKFVFRYRKIIAIGLISSWASVVAYFQNPQVYTPSIEKHFKTQEKRVAAAFNKFGKHACSTVYGIRFLNKICGRLKR
jgi:hypothetical protein